MRKTILFAAALMAMLCSCNKEQPVSPGPEPDDIVRRIQFGVSTLNASMQTKGGPLTQSTDATLDGGFNTFAVNDVNDTSYVNNVVATKISEGLFGVANYYWPTSGTLSFMGVYPSTIQMTNNSGAVSFPVGTSSSQWAAATDVIAAAALGAKNPNASGDAKGSDEVSLVFGHVLHWLSSVRFVKGDANATVKVLYVGLDAPGYGTYTLTKAAGAESGNPGQWSALPDSAAFKAYDMYGSKTATDGQAISKAKPASGDIVYDPIPAANLTDLMVIPSDDAVLHVKYSVTINGATETYKKQAELSLVEGKKSVISAELTNDLKPIKFNVVVENWDDDEQTPTLIPEPEE